MFASRAVPQIRLPPHGAGYAPPTIKRSRTGRPVWRSEQAHGGTPARGAHGPRLGGQLDTGRVIEHNIPISRFRPTIHSRSSSSITPRPAGRYRRRLRRNPAPPRGASRCRFRGDGHIPRGLARSCAKPHRRKFTHIARNPRRTVETRQLAGPGARLRPPLRCVPHGRALHDHGPISRMFRETR